MLSPSNLPINSSYAPLAHTQSYGDDRSLYSAAGTNTKGGMKKPLLGDGVGMDENGAAVELVTVPALGAE
jgi:hypothetical protein